MNIFEQYAEEYDAWFDRHPALYQSELNALKKAVPAHQTGLDIGSGTGRFAIPLNIRFGIEPSEAMRCISAARGFHSAFGVAEKLNFQDGSFQLLMMVTTFCFLDDPIAALREAFRVLRKNGSLVIGLIDKNSVIGEKYRLEKNKNKFYSSAKFYSTEELTVMLKKAGFSRFEYWQTLIENCSLMVEEPEKGYGKGGFVVVKAIKK